MGLLEKLKSVFGSGSDERSGSSDDADVTVEYAPEAQSEHAVKGTDEAGASDASEVERAAGADDPAEPDDPAGTDEPGAETDSTEDEDTPESPAVHEVKGIGPTYSDRLGTAGVETVADLAAADPEAVADAAKVSVSRAENWIERARSRT